MVLVKFAGALVLFLLIVALVVRGRRSSPRAAKVAARPALPPSPYQPSRGFRLLDGDAPQQSAPVELPRLDPLGEFVFTDTSTTEPVTPHLRHDERWALERSMRHAPPPRLRRRRRIMVTVLAVLVAGALVAALFASSHPSLHHAGVGVPFAATPSSWMM